MTQIAIVTLEGFNELDSLVAMTMLNRLRPHGWKAQIVSPTQRVTSMNGLTIEAQQPLSFASEADGVILGSGIKTKQWVEDEDFLEELALNTERQLIGAQCSGRQILNALGLVGERVAGPAAMMDAPLEVRGNVAWAGGCLAAQYLVTWMITRLGDTDLLEQVVTSVAPHGRQDVYLRRVSREVRLAEACGDVLIQHELLGQVESHG